MVLRRVVWRLALTAAVAVLMFCAGFYLGPDLLERFSQWLMPRLNGWDLGVQIMVRVHDLGPVDVGAWAAGIVGTTSLAWAFKPYRDAETISIIRASADPATVEPLPRLVFGAIPRPAPWFQPRPSEQEALARALADSRNAALAALPGRRGAGKSQLAAAYARQCDHDRFHLVAWINAEAGPVSELALLGRQLGLGGPDQTPEQIAAAVIRAVSVDDGRTRLIVFDNVADPDVVRPFLPATGTAKVIVTTNRQEFATMAGFKAIDVDVFTPGQGLTYLASATGQPVSDAAIQVGEELGWLPLALAQSAAYMRLSRLSYQQYLIRLRTVSLDETLVRQAGADHPGILQVIRLSMDSIDHSDSSGNPTALLILLAVLAPEGISRQLLTHPAALNAAGLNDMTVSRGVRLLTSASLVTLAERVENLGGPPSVEGDRVVVTVHRLTAAVVRHQAARGSNETLAAALNTAVNLLNALTDGLPVQQVAKRRSELDELVAHISAVRSNSPHPTSSVAGLTAWAADCLREVGDFSRAILTYEILIERSEATGGSKNPETLAHRDNLGLAYRSAGRHDEAIQLLEGNLADREGVLGAEDPYTMSSRNNLALAYRLAGRYADAIRLDQRNAVDRERILGRYDRDTLTSRNNLGLDYGSAGRHDEAIELLERNLADRMRILGRDDFDTLSSRNNLALAYESAGRYKQAIELYEENLADRERVLGPDHPRSLDSRNNLAGAYGKDGQHDKAIRLHQQTLAARERILGIEHPTTLTSRNNLAEAHSAAGDYTEAMLLHEQNLADRERVLGRNHRSTALSRTNLAAAYRAAGRDQDAKHPQPAGIKEPHQEVDDSE